MASGLRHGLIPTAACALQTTQRHIPSLLPQPVCSFLLALLQAVLGICGILIALFWMVKVQLAVAARQRQTARGPSTFETYKQAPVPGRGW